MKLSGDVPDVRVRLGNDHEVAESKDYVLYWMTAYRRTRWNFSLQRAVDWARTLKRPLVVLEGLRIGYPWASDRLHHFVIQGMEDNRTRFEKRNILYYPYLEPESGAGRGLLQKLSQKACVVIGDDYPCFFLPRMLQAASRQIAPRFELVDSNGIFPLRATDQVFTVAHSFRRFLQKNLRPHLTQLPKPNPLANISLPMMDVPKGLQKSWPLADVEKRARDWQTLQDFPIDHDVKVTRTTGGAIAAEKRMRDFVRQKLSTYDELRNAPDKDGSSGLSSYLHFGHISSHQVFQEVMKHEDWSLDDLAEKATGSREGWWHASPSGEAFLDQLITWRELGYNMCWQREDYDQYQSLPQWAQTTLAEHAKDRREYVYTLEEFEAAETHDELWNAAQRQLVQDGRIHNYLRMLWGKKILEWSVRPQDALKVLIELNNKYSLDGRDPNSYSGVFWCLGRYDRAWGPERPIFGKVRYMSSDNTARKVKVKGYLAKYGR